jgi:ectoine hydroxylase-related dioxygenase (phytanoyl-CoA dioxygenase family)
MPVKLTIAIVGSSIAFARLRAHPPLSDWIDPALVAVQCSAFEKSATRNWLVPVHQDLSIPVSARVTEPVLSGWSVKEGVQFVRAPAQVLAQLVAVRLHLDPCSADDGPLRVVPGSHLHGVLCDEEVITLRDAVGEWVCLAPIGSALVMRPLLLHASSKGNGTSLRRVLHFVFGPRLLPHGLAWNAAL